MKLTLTFRDNDARTALHFLRVYFDSKAGLEKLAKLAIQDCAAKGAQQVLDAMKAADEAREQEGK